MLDELSSGPVIALSVPEVIEGAEGVIFLE